MTESWTTVNLLPASSRFRSTLGAADDDVMFFEDENWESHIKSPENHFKFPFWRLDKHNVYKDIYNIHNLHNMFRMHMQNVLFGYFYNIYYTYTIDYIDISIYTFFETVPLCEWDILLEHVHLVHITLEHFVQEFFFLEVAQSGWFGGEDFHFYLNRSTIESRVNYVWMY